MARERRHTLRLVNSSGKVRNPAKATCHFCILAACFFCAAVAGAFVLSAVCWLASFVPAFASLATLQTAAITGGMIGTLVALLYHYLEALERDLNN